MSRNQPADLEYVGMIMKSWKDPKLPNTMREFLFSHRRTVALGTLIPIPMDELRKESILPLVAKDLDAYWAWQKDKQMKDIAMRYNTLKTVDYYFTETRRTIKAVAMR